MFYTLHIIVAADYTLPSSDLNTLPGLTIKTKIISLTHKLPHLTVSSKVAVAC